MRAAINRCGFCGKSTTHVTHPWNRRCQQIDLPFMVDEGMTASWFSADRPKGRVAGADRFCPLQRGLRPVRGRSVANRSTDPHRADLAARLPVCGGVRPMPTAGPNHQTGIPNSCKRSAASGSTSGCWVVLYIAVIEPVAAEYRQSAIRYDKVSLLGRTEVIYPRVS